MNVKKKTSFDQEELKYKAKVKPIQPKKRKKATSALLIKRFYALSENEEAEVQSDS